MAEKSFRVNGTTASRDETGLLSISVPFYVSTEAQALTIGMEPPYGLTEVGRKWSDSEEGLEGFMVTVDYEGFEEGKDDSDQESIEFDPSYSEEPIESHPDFDRLLFEFQGTLDENQKVSWPRKYTGLGEPLKAKGGVEQKNPMAGVTTYMALKAVFRRTYTVRNLPGNLLESIGEIVESLPGGFPTPSGRNWLRLPPKVSLRGNAYQISEELILSPPNETWTTDANGIGLLIT